jgi:hypothetical protein
MGFLILSKCNIPNQMMINLDKYEECSIITSDSFEIKALSVEDKHLAGALLHPEKYLN